MRFHLSILFLSLFSCSLHAADKFGNPVKLFADIYVPVMNTFEKTVIKTTLRGFIIRADSSPGIKQDEPSKYGISLIVSVADADREAVDKIENEKGYTRHLIQIPAPPHQEVALAIEYCYGSEVSSEIVDAITDRCVALKEP
jgi:hypothetical protein